MSQLVRLEGKHSTQNAHCAMMRIFRCELHCPIKWAGCKVYCDGIWSSDSCEKRKNDQCTTNEEWIRRKELIMAHLNSFRNAAYLINNANDKNFVCELRCH